MEQRLAALFATVGNALDSSTYTYSDSDYLVRKALTEFLDGENALVASARQIQDSSEVVDSILNYIVSTDFSVEDPAEWYRKAMRIVVEFSDFAFRNGMSVDSARYAALLPEGHPRALNSITLTASAQQSALAEWMAADPRLDEEASAQIRKLYSSSELDDLDLEFEYLKAEAMVASGKIPEDLLPLTAAFNLSRAQRSAISKFFEKFRRRDRKGRFAEEFGRLSLIFGDKKGGFFSKAPKIVGPGNGPDRAIVEFDGSDPRIPKGLYDVDATKGENVKAYLPTSAVKGLPKGREVVAEGDKQYAIGLDELLASKVETPLNWEKSGKGFKAKDGKFVAEPISNSDAGKAIDRARERGDELIIAGAGDGDAFDPEAEGGSFLVADAKGKTLGVAQDWAGIEEIAIANGSAVDDFQPFKRAEDDFPELKAPEKDSRFEGFRPYDGRDVQATNRNAPKRAERKRLEDALGRKLTDDEISALGLELESESFVGKRSPYEGAEFYVPGQDAKADAKYKAYEKKRAETLRNLKAELDGKTSSPDLDQDVPSDIDKSKLSPSMLGEGYNFSKEGENSWVQEGVGSNGESYSVSKAPNGKWVVSERSGSEGDNAKERDLQSFDSAEEAFDFANDQGTSPNEFDEAWVNELMSEGGPDLDQNVTGPKNKLDVADFSPKDRENSQKYIDSANQAIFNNDRAKLNDTISRAANDSNVSDEAYSALLKARDARDARDYEVENALAGGSREDIEALLEDPEYSGWASRLEDALNVDLDQEAPTLSEKQSEPASGKQYAFLDEFLAERQLDPTTEQAFKDAIANKNLNKAQASSLIAIGRSADFKADVDPSKPSERMLNSLQGYLATKDLAPSEIKEVLDSLQKDSSRDNVDALLNKLRRKKDKPVDLNQGVSGMTRHSDGSYSWEDDYNNINVNNTSRGWEVEYTSPSMEDGVNDWYYKSFASEDEALAFAEDLLKQNQGDGGYGRAADNLFDRGGASADVDLDQDVKGALADAATDKQWDFLQSLLDGKKITNPELESAVRSALADRNLTKGEVGAFIGQLRPLEDKPNVRREPSAKQIASIKRALLERDMTTEERKSMQDKLAAGLSFDEASEMLNDLKKRDITPEGMDNLLRELKSEQDIDTLRYLLDKPEYSKYRSDVKDILRQLALDTEDPYLQEFIDAREDIDLDQDISDSAVRDRIAEKLAEDIDALDSLAINGKELKNYLEEFDRTSYASTAAEMAFEVENMSNYVDDPELKQRLRDLSSRLNDEIVDRFGIADAARADGDEILDLDDIERAVQDDIEMFFETDADKIIEALDRNDSYGDSKSGGAEVFVSQEDDGTWTASVQYDRSDDQFNGEDRDEVIAQAAVAAADYSSDVMPTAYSEIDDLPGQASQAQTPDAASELADRMDALAAAMSESRGDQGLASNLRQYGMRIREMIEKRDRQRQSEVESEPLNSETMDEMATDPDLNPAGYADYIANQVFELVGGKQSGVTAANNFISSDRRVELVVEKDGEYTVIVDGEEVFSGEGTSDRWEFVAGVEKAIEEHFSKKA